MGPDNSLNGWPRCTRKPKLDVNDGEWHPWKADSVEPDYQPDSIHDETILEYFWSQDGEGGHPGWSRAQHADWPNIKFFRAIEVYREPRVLWYLNGRYCIGENILGPLAVKFVEEKE